MKIKLKVSLSGISFSYYEGQEVEVDEDTSKQWINAGYAEQILSKKAKAEK